MYLATYLVIFTVFFEWLFSIFEGRTCISQLQVALGTSYQARPVLGLKLKSLSKQKI